MENFDDVSAQYEPMISAVIRKLNIYRDFEDFRQAGYIALWQAWSRFDKDKGNFTPFAYRSIYGAMLDEMKKENRYSERQAPVDDQTLELMESYSMEEDRFPELDSVLKTLYAEEKQLLSMLYTEKKSQTFCADFFGISVAGVKKRRERLLKKLRERLTEVKQDDNLSDE
ncbi:sigma-70 family RNA polymerase sigma factor [Sporosarcina cascadiensis]|uniref:sigma-70 family RNA polymerase sigma factor n=2 Tax=Sporosarcina TaxID=1569 RepID=UPI00129A5D26|nr:sigma-70 family RNA polymerase sigma factor [Sporosarcina cascadiensis]